MENVWKRVLAPLPHLWFTKEEWTAARLFPEDETAVKHGEYSRFFPTGTEQFTRLYGRRNATESWHAELKRMRRRPPVRGMAMQSFYLSCMIVLQNARNIERMRRAAAPPGGKSA